MSRQTIKTTIHMFFEERRIWKAKMSEPLKIKVIKRWDPDFTKSTPKEKERLERADKEMKNYCKWFMQSFVRMSKKEF